MRRPLQLLCLLLALGVSAAELRLAWDASLTPGVTNYTLFASTNALTATNLSSASVKVNTGTNLSVVLDNLSPARWWFTSTATKDGAMSDPSNVLVVDVPKPPTLMRVVVPQYNATLAGSNWVDAGYFRLRIEP